FGLNGSETSYCRSSPVPQQLTYRNRSSSDRLMSVTSGGTAPNGAITGGSTDASAGSAGISITFFVFHSPVCWSRYHRKIELDRSFRLMTTPTKPYARRGLCAGRSSSAICCSAPRSSFSTCLRVLRSQTCSAFAVLAAQQQLRVHAVLDHVRRAPLAGDHRVVAQVPPEVVRELLRAPLLLPAPLHLERLVVQHEDAARAVAVRRAQRVHVDAVRPAVHRVRRRVARLLHHLLALDHLHQPRAARVRARVDDEDVRGADAGDDQVAALDVCVR